MHHPVTSLAGETSSVSQRKAPRFRACETHRDEHHAFVLGPHERVQLGVVRSIGRPHAWTLQRAKPGHPRLAPEKKLPSTSGPVWISSLSIAIYRPFYRYLFVEVSIRVRVGRSDIVVDASFRSARACNSSSCARAWFPSCGCVVTCAPTTTLLFLPRMRPDVRCCRCSCGRQKRKDSSNQARTTAGGCIAA